MDANTDSPYKQEADELLHDLLSHSKSQSQTQVRQLFIGNLPFRVRWQDIKDQFRKAGQVVRADVALNYDNRSKGHGTVLFATLEDAQKAIDMFDNFKWLGRIIEVRGDRGFIDTDSKKSVAPSPKPASPSIPQSPKQAPKKEPKKQTTPKQPGPKQPSTKQSSVSRSPTHPSSLKQPKTKETLDKSVPKQPVTKQPVTKQLVLKQQVPKQIPEKPSLERSSHRQSSHSGLSAKQPSPKVESLSVTEKGEEEEKDDDDDCKQLFVGNLPFQCQWQDLKDLFKSAGRIVRADVVLNFEGRSRGFGTVLFSNHKDAKQAIEQYNGFEFHNRILRVHFDKFAASHQRFREHEENTFGQRQIHDPESIELLRQTYSSAAPQYNSYATPYQSFGGVDMYQGMMQQSASFGYYYPSQNTMYGYNTQQWVQPPLMQYPNEELTPLSTSLDSIHIYNTPRNGESAGLTDRDTPWY